MKRKLFTLLLAIVGLAAFQANAQAQLKVRILADKSGLAKTSWNGNDSFPYVKKAGLYNWLSYSGDTYLNLKVGIKMNGTGTDSIQVQKDLLGDKESVFRINFFGDDSTKFQITPVNGKDPVELKHSKGATNLFSILKLRTTDAAKTKSDGLVANFTQYSDTIAGYLAYVPDAKKGNQYKLDTLPETVALVGFDEKNNALKLKYFNEFAFYADTLPLMLQSFQFGSEDNKEDFHPGRLYRTDSFPYLQIYDKTKKALIYSSRNSTAANTDGKDSLRAVGKPTNWGSKGAIGNKLDSVVYSWLDIKLSGDTAIVLPGYRKVPETGKLEDSTAIVRLDALFKRAHDADGKNIADVRFDTAKWASSSAGYLKPDSILGSWDNPATSNTDSVVYLQREKRGNEYYLSFTVKLTHNGKVSDWTNGYPTTFKYKEGSGNKAVEKDVYYFVGDTTFMALLDSIYVDRFGYTTQAYNSNSKNFTPYDSLGARYVYKNNDESWKPLYVKVQQVNDSAEAKRKYEYVESSLLRERKLLDTRVTQEVDLTGLSDKYISNGRAGDEINLTGKEGAASFFITLADTIRSRHRDTDARHWFAKEQYSYSNDNRIFANEDSVELFNIKNENGLYLTVAGKSAFNPPLKNVMRWDSVLNEDGESVRQMFAIVRNCFDDTYTFLPVAAHDWAEGGDTLSFNLNIGRDNTDGKIVDIEGAWRLESSLSHQVVVADTTSEREPLRLKLSSPLHLWNRANGVVALKDKESGVFYRGDNTTAYKDVLKKNDIGALWKVEKDWADGKYKFTPVLTTAGKQAFADTVLTVYSADDITVQFELNDTTKKYKYEIEVVDNSDEDFDLYTGFDFEWNNNKGFVTLRSGDGRYISYGSKDHPEEVLYKDEVSTVTIHKDTEGVLFSGTDYPVQYYRFSYKKDKDNYFLKAEGSIISWEKGINPETNPRYKFSMPEAFDAGKFYLQHKDGALIQVSKDGTKLSLATEQTVYSALNAINDAKEPLTLQWTIAKADVPAQWATVDIGADSTSSVGVLAVRGAGETFVGRDGTNGVLRDKTVASSVLLKVKAAQVYSPQSVSVVAYSQATAESDVRVDYYIIHEDSLYLTERTDGSVVFEKSETHNRFAFLATEDGFAIVSGDEEDYHYLTSTGLSLHFTENENDKLSFEWGNPSDYGIITGIKVINASQAKVYGVAGGVKVANATGAVAIYTIDGRLVTTQAVTSPNRTIAVPSGIYIVRNGAEVAKVIVK